MKRWRELIRLALLDEKSKRKSQRLISILTVLSVSIFLLIHAFLGSVIQGSENIINKPLGRVVFLPLSSGEQEPQMEEIRKKLETKEYVDEIYWHTGVTNAEWENAKVTGKQKVDVNLVSEIQSLQKYIVDGDGHLSEGEILIPKYLYDMGIYDEYTYADGGELVGKTLNFQVTGQYVQETREYSFVVAGTYDNINSACVNNMFFISGDDSMELFLFVKCEGQEAYIEEVTQGYDMSEEAKAEMLQNYMVGISLKPGYDLKKASEEIESCTGIAAFPFMTYNENLVLFYTLIIEVADLLMIMFAVTAVIMFFVMLAGELKTLKNQFAIRTACGYTLRQQIGMYIVEKGFFLGRNMIIGMILSAIPVLVYDYIMQKLGSLYDKHICFTFDWGCAGLVVLVIGVCIVAMSVVTICSVRRISVAETLKKEAVLL